MSHQLGSNDDLGATTENDFLELLEPLERAGIALLQKPVKSAKHLRVYDDGRRPGSHLSNFRHP